MELSIVPSYDIKNRKFKHKSVRMRGDESKFTSFKECRCYVTVENGNEYNKEEYIWPSFLIKLLENKEIHQIYK